MATIETRQFGSTKHLLVITDLSEAELVSNTLGREFTQIRGVVKIADGWGETYLELQKGTKDVDEKLAADLKEIAAWHISRAKEVQMEESKMHRKWAKLLEKAAGRV